MSPAPAPPPLLPALHHRVFKRTSRVVRDRRSFRHLSLCADHLELGSADSSSPDSIAASFLSKQQEAVETRLLAQQQQLHRLAFPRLIDLLRFSADCSWRASLLCAALFKDILDAKRSIARIQFILDSPSCHNQVDDLLLALADLHSLFSEETLDNIRRAKDLLSQLISDLKSHRERIRVRALSRISALKRRTKDGMLPVLRHLGANVRSRLCMCSTPMSYGSHTQTRGLSIGKDYADDASEDEAFASIGEADDDSNATSFDSQSSQQSVISSLHMAHVRFHHIERSMFGVSRTLETLIPVVSGTHNQGLSQHLIELLRDPLMFDGVAAQIAVCNENLSNHLWDVRAQVLNCFCFINRARDHAYEI